MIDISRALTIQGWMTEPELLWLAEQASKHKVIAELGCFLGRSTRALADNTPGTVYAIDDWYGPRAPDITNLPDDVRSKLFDIFVHNMEGLEGRLNVVRQNHEQATLDVCPDMVFIDGDHSYANVKRDIATWMERVSPGGLLGGHDYWHVGVYQAVNELVSGVRCVPDTSIWYAEKAFRDFRLK